MSAPSSRPSSGRPLTASKLAQRLNHAQTTDAQILGFPELTPQHTSLMAQELTREMYARMKRLKTSTGCTVDHVLQPGVDYPGADMGVMAGDEESYHLFRELFDAVIFAWHGERSGEMHKYDMTPSHITDGVLPDEFIISTRMRAARNIRGFPLPSRTSRAARREVLRIVENALTPLTDDLTGQLHHLSDLTADQEQELLATHVLFVTPRVGSLLEVAGAARDWPAHRAVFHNDDKTLVVWCNEEDHLRVISMEPGGNVSRVFERFCRAVQTIESNIADQGHDVMYNDHHGFIGACPSNLGTALRASVLVKLPLLAQDFDRFVHICALLHLEVRDPHVGDHIASADGVYDVGNKHRLAHSEAEVVQTVINGVRVLIDMELKLRAGDDIETMIPRQHIAEVEINPGPPYHTENSSIAVDPLAPPGDNNFPELKLLGACTSLMARHLTPQLYEDLHLLKTAAGFTLDQAIQLGLDAPQTPVGLLAGDAECYTTFADLFDPVIASLHNFHRDSTPQGLDLDARKLITPAAFDAHVVAVHIDVHRNLRGFSLTPAISRTERMQVENILAAACAALPEDLAGTYHSLNALPSDLRVELAEERLLLSKPDGGAAAGVARDWPSARGVHCNAPKALVVWCNVRDHLQVTARQPGNDAVSVWDRCVRALAAIEAHVETNGYGYVRSERLGFLTACPSLLGTGMTARAVVRMPRLGTDRAALAALCRKLDLELSAEDGMGAEMCGIATRIRLGRTEVEILQGWMDGVGRLVGMETAMAGGTPYAEVLAAEGVEV